MKFKAVIFDMDGVLIDSEYYWIQAEMSFLGKYSVKLTKELNAEMTGKSLVESVTILKNRFNLEPSVEVLLEDKKVFSDAIYEYQAQKMPGVDELLKKVKTTGGLKAIASGSSSERIKKIVERCGWGLSFDCIVSTDHVNFVGKPDPAIYLYTAKQLNIDPKDCVVIEDSVNGVRSAKAAGMQCVAVPDPRWSWGDFSGADIEVKSLADENLFKFLGIPVTASKS